ncbi:MAG: ribose-phosphate diphosphokinase [Phycisphaerae bacterium]
MGSRASRTSDASSNGLVVFGGTASIELADKICRYVGVARGKATIGSYPDGETLIKLEEDVRGQDCFVVQSTCPPVNSHLMELLIFLDSLRRASAKRITAVIPYYGYARQDRKSEGRMPITAKLVANMVTTAGADRVLTMNLHADQIQGFFDIPLDHLTAAPVLARHFLEGLAPDSVLVSPDVGNLKFGSDFASRLGIELAVVDKRRVSGDKTMAVTVIGDVAGKNVMMFDDMITTAGTVCEAARLVREHGARDVYVAATHGIFAGPALERLQAAELTEIVVSDTIPVSDEVRKGLKSLTILSVADLIGEAIRRIHEHRSVSALFC